MASCLTVTSGSGGPFASTIRGAACVLVLKAAAVSISKIVLFNFRLPFLGGPGFVTGGAVPYCWIWLLGLDACDEALSLAPVGAV